MPQLQLPTFPIGVTPITSLLGFLKEDKENVAGLSLSYFRPPSFSSLQFYRLSDK